MKAEHFKTEDWLRLALKAGKMSVWHWDVKTNTVSHLSEFMETSEPEALRIRAIPRAREILDGGEASCMRFEGVHAEDIPLLQEVVKAAISEKREYQVVYRNICDGTIRWIEERGVGTYDRCGECVAVKGLIADITDRRKPEEELRTARKELEEHLTRSDRDFSTLVENSTDIIYRLDRSLRFLYVGPAVQWVLGMPVKLFTGRTPREVGPHSLDCRGFEESCNYVFETAQRIVREFYYEEKCYCTRIIPEFSLEGAVESVLCIDQDVTERKRIEKELRSLSARLLDIQDEERRRIARELHDSTAQNLFAISMSLARVSQEAVAVEVKEALAECASLCETSREEIRTLAYLLHPPMLDEAGLVSALGWYIEGFSRRSGVAVTLVVGQQQLTRLSMEIETDLFRIVQECLANVHRHSGSETAIVRVDEEPGQLVLQIEDRGRGIPGWDGMAAAPGSLGVGILGMRERLGQLGGRLEIKSGNSGTTIAAIVPLANRSGGTKDCETLGSPVHCD